MSVEEDARLLGVDPEAPLEELKKAYRQAARRAHPDFGGTNGLFQAVQNAYERLAAALTEGGDGCADAEPQDDPPPEPSKPPTPPADPSWHPGLVLGRPGVAPHATTAKRLATARLGRDTVLVHDVTGRVKRRGALLHYRVDHVAATEDMLVTVFDQVWQGGRYRSRITFEGDWQLECDLRLAHDRVHRAVLEADLLTEDLGWQNSVAVVIAVHGDGVDLDHVSPPKKVRAIVPAGHVTAEIAGMLDQAKGPATEDTVAALEAHCEPATLGSAWSGEPGVDATALPRHPDDRAGRRQRLARGGVRGLAALLTFLAVPAVLSTADGWAPRQAAGGLLVPVGLAVWAALSLGAGHGAERVLRLRDRSPVRTPPVPPAAAWWALPAALLGALAAPIAVGFGVDLPTLPATDAYAGGWWPGGRRALDAAGIGLRLGAIVAVLVLSAVAGWRAVAVFRAIARWRARISSALQRGGLAQARLVFELRHHPDPVAWAWVRTLQRRAPECALAGWLREPHRPER